MNIKFWSHRNGFRSPTEQQLARWETDGGNYRDCEEAVLWEGRLYNSQAELLRARAQKKVKRVIGFLQDQIDSRFDLQRQASH